MEIVDAKQLKKRVGALNVGLGVTAIVASRPTAVLQFYKRARIALLAQERRGNATASTMLDIFDTILQKPVLTGGATPNSKLVTWTNVKAMGNAAYNAYWIYGVLTNLVQGQVAAATASVIPTGILLGALALMQQAWAAVQISLPKVKASDPSTWSQAITDIATFIFAIIFLIFGLGLSTAAYLSADDLVNAADRSRMVITKNLLALQATAN